MGKENVRARTQGQGCFGSNFRRTREAFERNLRHSTGSTQKMGKGREGNGPVSSFVRLSHALVYASRYIMWNKSDCGVPVAFSRFFIAGERSKSTVEEYIMETVKKNLFSQEGGK